MNENTASVHWEGAGKKGQGQIGTETGALDRHLYGFSCRFEGGSRDCPLSKALAAVAEISLQTTLEGVGA